MKIIKYSDIENIERYSLFHQQSYSKYESIQGWKVIFIADDKGVIIPLKLRKSRLIKQGQYLYPPLKNGNRLSADDEKLFLESLISFCRAKNICDFISPPSHFSLFQCVPAQSYFTELGITIVDLEKSEDELFRSFRSNCRNQIRKTINEQLTVEFGNHLFEIFYNLYKGTHQRQRAYHDAENVLKNLVNTLGEKYCRIAVVKREEEVYGAALVLFNSGEAYYFQSGSIENCPFRGSNKLLQFEIIKWLKRQGVTRYCLGGYRLGDISGTKFAGIQEFKMDFGGVIEKGYHFYSAVTWRYSVYKFLLGIYLKMRGVAQNTAGLNWRYN